MFRPGATFDEIEHDVETMISELVHTLGRMSDADPDSTGAGARAYIRTFADARANSDRDQAALLSTAAGRPNLAESLIYLNRRLDQEDLDPREPTGIIGVIVRLAMDGLWVSDILDNLRFGGKERRRITDVLTRMTYLTDSQLENLLAEATPDRRAARAPAGRTAG